MSQFYIASLKHTHNRDEHITFWRPFHRGYTQVVDRFGRYCFGEASSLNDGESVIAVPVIAIDGLTSPTPYWKPGALFYDYAGPVVQNTRANWNALIKASFIDGRYFKPKPEVFRGKRRSIYTEGAVPA